MALVGIASQYTKKYTFYTSEPIVRTNIDIDDKLMSQAMRASGATTKKAVVEEALRMLVRTRSQASIRDLFGTVEWEGDLKRSRQGRFPK